MSRVRIIGIGSPSGDDQAGWLTVDALGKRDLGAAVMIEKLDRPGAALVARLADADWVILVDAMAGGAAPGAIHHFGPRDWNTCDALLSSHGFGVIDALALAQALGGLPERLDVYGIGIAPPAPGAPVAAVVRRAADALARHIAAAVAAAQKSSRRSRNTN